MAKHRMAQSLLEQLSDRQPFFYILVGGNLVGGSLALAMNILWRPDEQRIWLVVVCGLDFLVAGMLTARIATYVELIYKRLEVKARGERDNERIEAIKRELIDEEGDDILGDFRLAITLIAMAFMLMLVRSYM